MPEFNIDGFKANIDNYARQYLFYYQPVFPAGVGADINKVSYMVRSTTAPTNTNEEITANWQGYDFKVAGRNTFADFTISFNVDRDVKIIQYFYDWMDIAHNPESNEHANNISDYMANQELWHLGLQGQPASKYILYHAWVKEVTGVTLDYGANDIAQFDVTFAYARHKFIR